MFFVPHSTCSQGTKAHSLLPLQKHKQSLLSICIPQPIASGLGSYEGWKISVLSNFISGHNWDRVWFGPNLKPTAKIKQVLSVVTTKTGLKIASLFRPHWPRPPEYSISLLRGLFLKLPKRDPTIISTRKPYCPSSLVICKKWNTFLIFQERPFRVLEKVYIRLRKGWQGDWNFSNP